MGLSDLIHLEVYDLVRATSFPMVTATVNGQMTYIIVGSPRDTFFTPKNGPISWTSRKQPTVSTSTCEAEFIAQHEAACEAVWLQGLLGEIGVFGGDI